MTDLDKEKLAVEKYKAKTIKESIIGAVGSIAVCLGAYLLNEPNLYWAMIFVIILAKE